MLLKTRIQALVLVVGLAAGAGAIGRVAYERDDVDTFLAIERASRGDALGQIFQLSIKARQTWVFDNSYWDDLVAFARGSSPATWGEETFGDTLGLLDADGLFVFDADRRLVFATVAEGEDAAVLAPSADDLFGPTRVRTYFRAVGDTPLEVSSATIHPTADAAHETPPQGVLAVVKRWDADALVALAASTGAPLAITAPDAPMPTATAAEVVVQSELPGASGAPVGMLRATYPMPALGQLVERRLATAALETAMVLVMVAVAAALVGNWILRPLARITAALDARDPSTLDADRRRPDEFGVLARLVTEHFDQATRMQAEIADRVAAEAEVTRSLHEKEVLLREIHHRVKNNLQVISSLLALQADLTEHASSRASIQESVFRVRSMAYIHQQLYGTESLSRIDLGEHARSLADALRGGLAPSARVEVEVRGAVSTDAELAVPIGLILNELLTNAFKYGVPRSPAAPPPNDGAWDVRISLASEGNLLVAHVRDRGPGVPERFSLQGSRTLGLQVVRALLRQVKGTLTWRNDGGAVFELRIPLEGAEREPASVAPSRLVSPR